MDRPTSEGGKMQVNAEDTGREKLRSRRKAGSAEAKCCENFGNANAAGSDNFRNAEAVDCEKLITEDYNCNKDCRGCPFPGAKCYPSKYDKYNTDLLVG